jgi:hypothetical protein
MARRRKDGTYQQPLPLMSVQEKAEAKGHRAAAKGAKPSDNPYWQGKRKTAWERGYQRKVGGLECGAA